MSNQPAYTFLMPTLCIVCNFLVNDVCALGIQCHAAQASCTAIANGKQDWGETAACSDLRSNRRATSPVYIPRRHLLKLQPAVPSTQHTKCHTGGWLMPQSKPKPWQAALVHCQKKCQDTCSTAWKDHGPVAGLHGRACCWPGLLEAASRSRSSSSMGSSGAAKPGHSMLTTCTQPAACRSRCAAPWAGASTAE